MIMVILGKIVAMKKGGYFACLCICMLTFSCYAASSLEDEILQQECSSGSSSGGPLDTNVGGNKYGCSYKYPGRRGPRQGWLDFSSGPQGYQEYQKYIEEVIGADNVAAVTAANKRIEVLDLEIENADVALRSDEGGEIIIPSLARFGGLRREDSAGSGITGREIKRANVALLAKKGGKIDLSARDLSIENVSVGILADGGKVTVRDAKFDNVYAAGVITWDGGVALTGVELKNVQRGFLVSFGKFEMWKGSIDASLNVLSVTGGDVSLGGAQLKSEKSTALQALLGSVFVDKASIVSEGAGDVYAVSLLSEVSSEIMNTSIVSKDGGALFVDLNSSKEAKFINVKMTGGGNNTLSVEGGKAYFMNGSITANSEIGISVKEEGNVNLSFVDVKGGNVRDSTTIFVDSGGQFEMQLGSITSKGKVLSVKSGGVATLESVEVKNLGAGGILVEGGTLTVDDGTITSEGRGGSISIQGGKATFKNVIVKHEMEGGRRDAAIVIDETGTFEMSAGELDASGIGLYVKGNESSRVDLNSVEVKSSEGIAILAEKGSVKIGDGWVSSNKNAALNVKGGNVSLTKTIVKGEYNRQVRLRGDTVAPPSQEVLEDAAVIVNGGVLRTTEASISGDGIGLYIGGHSSYFFEKSRENSTIRHRAVGRRSKMISVWRRSTGIITTGVGSVISNGGSFLSETSNAICMVNGEANLTDVTVTGKSISRASIFVGGGKLKMGGGRVISEGRGIRVRGSGSVTLDNVEITEAEGEERVSVSTKSKSDSYAAIFVEGGDLKMQGGKVTSKNMGLRVSPSSSVFSSEVSVSLSDVKVTSKSDSHAAIFAGGGKLKIEGGDITSGGMGIMASGGVSISLTGVQVTGTNLGGISTSAKEVKIKKGKIESAKNVGLYIWGGHVSLTNTNIESKSDNDNNAAILGMSGVLSMQGGNVVAASYGIYSGGESFVNLHDVSVSSKGPVGVFVSGGAVKMQRGKVTSKGMGLRIDPSSLVSLSDVTVTSDLEGMFVLGGTVKMQRGSLNSSGLYSAIYVGGGKADLFATKVRSVSSPRAIFVKSGEFVMTEGEVITMNDGFHIVGGNSRLKDVAVSTGRRGIFVEGGTVRFKKGKIESRKTVAVEVAGGDITFTDSSIESKSYSHAAVFNNGGSLRIEKGTVLAFGKGVHVEGSGTTTLVGTHVEGKTGLFGKGGGSLSMDGRAVSFVNAGVHATNASKMSLSNVEISKSSNSALGTHSRWSVSAIRSEDSGSTIVATNVTVKDASSKVTGTTLRPTYYAVEALNGGAVTLNDSVIELTGTDFRNTGLHAVRGTINMAGGSITVAGIGVLTEGINPLAFAGYDGSKELTEMGSSVTLTNTLVRVRDGYAGVFVTYNGDVSMKGGSLEFTDGHAVALWGDKLSGSGSFTADGTTIRRVVQGDENGPVESSAFYISKSGTLTLRGSKVDVSGVHGLWITSDYSSYRPSGNYDRYEVNMEHSSVSVEGAGAYGVYFYEAGVSSPAEQVVKKDSFGVVRLKATNYSVPKGVAIYSHNSSGYLELSKRSHISGDLLLEASNGSNVIVHADQSSLTGNSRLADTSTAELYLVNDSKWTLTRSAFNDRDPFSSHITRLFLGDSVVAFSPPEAAGAQYQTLHIGSGVGSAYIAGGNAHLFLNVAMDNRGNLYGAKADRVLVHGDVAGLSTNVHVIGHVSNIVDDAESIDDSVSLIQVSGRAQENSFKLVSSYVALNGFPYQYELKAYGPSSSSKKGSSSRG
ncbi:hypothetical protein PU02_0121 [Bartonella ancashensis]|uniref:Right handed beta helix domain-containing protein n=3 Tax=Bartonella ancashensis TaxID=1318743 RepID=A0A0M3T2L3_9HYPH|nr:hypothetical protein PU02_0121 [Bartonella ancashensis]